MENAWAFWHMTPNEIAGRFTAFSESRNNDLMLADKIAWMIGNYVGVATNNPKKFPDKPNMIKKESKSMDEKAIKSTLIAYAEMHNAIEEGKNGSHA